MAKKTIITKRKRREFAVTLFFALAAFYFSYHAISGRNGVLGVLKLKQRLETARTELDEVKLERMQLENRVNRLYTSSLDTDILDEQARLMMGYARKSETVYFLPRKE